MGKGSDPFRIGVTRDFLKPDGSLGFGDIGLDILDAADGVKWEFLGEQSDELRADQVRGFDGLLVLAPRVTAQTLEGADRLKIVARFGVGYDSIDVDACTESGVLLTITPDGVRRPVAVGVITFLLALTHKLVAKDQLVRRGGWNEKLDFMGQGVTDRTVGIIGLGNIGREVARLAAPFGMKLIGHDPNVDAEEVADLGIGVVDLETLLTSADFVIVCCALVPATRHLLNADRLALLKPTAYVINVARGPVIDQAALTTVLRDRRIQGAALDVFEQEPIDPADPLLQLDNVLLAPHAICWTDEMFRGIGRSACTALVDVANGRAPRWIVNREALGHEKLGSLNVRGT